MTISFNIAADAAIGDTITLDLGDYVTSGVTDAGATADGTQLGNLGDVTFTDGAGGNSSTATAATISGNEITITIGGATLAKGTAKSSVVLDSRVGITPPTGDDCFGQLRWTLESDVAAANTARIKNISSCEPGAAVRIEVSGTATEGVAVNEDIEVDLGKLNVPGTIVESRVLMYEGAVARNPEEIAVSGSKVTLTVPNFGTDLSPSGIDGTTAYRIVFKQSAGVTNPAAAGEQTLKVKDNDADNDTAEGVQATEDHKVTIQRVIKLSKKDGTRGTETTATFKGFSNGTATVDLNGEKLGEVTIIANSGTRDIDTSSSKFLPNKANRITAEDASGNDEDVSATFTIKPTVKLDPAETEVSKMVTVKLSDWPVSHQITKIQIGGTDANLPDANASEDGHQNPQTGTDGKVNIPVLVKSEVNRGTQTVKVTGSEVDGEDAPTASASLKVGVLELSIQPVSAVPGQEITIQGGGFVAGDVISSVTIGNQSETVSATANSAGDIVITLRVPSRGTNAIGDGEQTVSVKAVKGGIGSTTAHNSNREGEGTLTIPESSVTLNPETSRRGTSVSVSGSGFPAGDLNQSQDGMCTCRGPGMGLDVFREALEP